MLGSYTTYTPLATTVLQFGSVLEPQHNVVPSQVVGNLMVHGTNVSLHEVRSVDLKLELCYIAYLATIMLQDPTDICHSCAQEAAGLALPCDQLGLTEGPSLECSFLLGCPLMSLI
jgi:hypothetical protein